MSLDTKMQLHQLAELSSIGRQMTTSGKVGSCMMKCLACDARSNLIHITMSHNQKVLLAEWEKSHGELQTLEWNSFG